MFEVLKISNQSDQQCYALKISYNADFDTKLAAKNLKEIQTITEHPNILRLYNVLSWQDISKILEEDNELAKNQHTFALVYELADSNLFDEINRRVTQRKYFTLPEITSMLREIVDAMSFAKSQFGINHGNIKPENLLFVKGLIKVADYGLSDLNLQSKKQINIYQPPEHISTVQEIEEKKAKTQIKEKQKQDSKESDKASNDGENKSTTTKASQKEPAKKKGDSIDPKERKDIWSLGICMIQAILMMEEYALLGINENGKLLIDDLCAKIEKKYDKKLAEVIKKMVSIDPEKRLTLQQLEKYLAKVPGRPGPHIHFSAPPHISCTPMHPPDRARCWAQISQAAADYSQTQSLSLLRFGLRA